MFAVSLTLWEIKNIKHNNQESFGYFSFDYSKKRNTHRIILQNLLIYKIYDSSNLYIHKQVINIQTE